MPGLLKIDAVNTDAEADPKTPVLSGSLVGLELTALIGLINDMAICPPQHTLTNKF